jgi:hypothetical protein
MKKKKEIWSKEQSKKHYPRIVQFNIEIQLDPMEYVKWTDIKKALNKKQHKQFNSLFGIQTCYIDGAYPWDVEAVLERMVSGELTGTQLEWD